MGLAGIFMERDGGPTMLDLVILGAMTLVAAAAFLQLFLRRRRQRREALSQVAANTRSIAWLYARERKLEDVVGDMRGHILAEWGTPPRPELKVYKGGRA